MSGATDLSRTDTDIGTGTLAVNGACLAGDPAGALWWAERRLLAVADLHLEKGSSFAAARAGLLPPYDSRATLVALRTLVERYRPATVICLGDSFHDRGAAGRLGDHERAELAALTAAADWLWIAGNHDPEPPAGLGGRSLPEIAVGPLVFRHQADGRTPGEIAGHLHPKAAVRVRGRRLTRRCFASDGRRLVLPAFGAYAGGLCVLDPAFRPLFPGGFHAWMLGRRTLYPVRSSRLEPI